MLKFLTPILAGIVVVLLASQASAGGVEYRYHEWYWGNGPWWETPEENNAWSQFYDHLLQVNLRFRAYHIVKECGPIDDPPLHADCVASFNIYEPVAPYAH
jgi:hypothetical protein